MQESGWARDWTVGVRVWIDRQGETVLGEGRAELLEAIGHRQSITSAAKAVGMSYRKAWSLVQEINEAAGQPLVEAAVGGTKGGGARLTESGRIALDLYRQLRRELTKSAVGVVGRLLPTTTTTTAEPAPCVHVAAAISMQEALGQILAEFALHRPLIRVRAVYGASDELAAHLLAGAPGSLFISAEADPIDRLMACGKAIAASRRVIALNGLAVIGPKRRSDVMGLKDLESSAVKSIALAEPNCPLGRYAKTYLETAGVYDQLLPKVVHVDNSRAVLSAVAAGVAEVGVAFLSDATRSGECQLIFRLPRSKVAAKYIGAVIAGGDDQDATEELLNFISSPAAARCLRRCGFHIPTPHRRRAKA